MTIAGGRHSRTAYEQTWDDAEVRELRHRIRRFVVPVTTAMIIWFLTYLFLSAFAHGLMAHKVVGNITVALVLSLGQLASLFAVTAWYLRYAARRIDPLVDRIRDAAREQS